MTYIVSHKTYLLGIASARFKKVKTFGSAPDSQDLDRFGIKRGDKDYTVRALACLTAEALGVNEGEFLVRYTADTVEYTALVKVSRPPAPSFESGVI